MARLGGASDAFAPFDDVVRRRWNAYEEARAFFYANEPRWAGAPFWRRRQGGVSVLPPASLSVRSEEAHP